MGDNLILVMTTGQVGNFDSSSLNGKLSWEEKSTAADLKPTFNPVTAAHANTSANVISSDTQPCLW